MKARNLCVTLSLACAAGCDLVDLGTLEAQYEDSTAPPAPDPEPAPADEPEPAPEAPAEDNDLDDDGITTDFDCDDHNNSIGGEQFWRLDLDGDEVAGLETVKACVKPDNGRALDAPVDCDDNNWSVHPGALELCNGIDEDCDGVADNGLLYAVYPDGDLDLYGDDLAGVSYVCVTMIGQSSVSGDCNNDNPDIHPGALEVCNSLDDDCDGQNDEGFAYDFGWPDVDGDGDGDPNGVLASGCPGTLPLNYVGNNVDCDDGAANIHPQVGGEICNGQDDNCDGQIDESEPDINLCDDGNPYTTDTCDGGNGCTYEAAMVHFACELPEGYSEDEFVCGSAAFFLVDGAQPPNEILPEQDELTVPIQKVCEELALGKTLHTNTYVWDLSDVGATWVGGLHTTVSFEAEELNGSPDQVTWLYNGLDFVYDFSDFEPFCAP